MIHVEGYELEDSDFFMVWQTDHPEINGAGDTEDQAIERLEMVMQQFRDEFGVVDMENPVEILN